ncbi:hypothetical protein ACWCQK_41385 [Streptomyces sp. NPDC002306]
MIATGTGTRFLEHPAQRHDKVCVMPADAATEGPPAEATFDIVHGRLALGGLSQSEHTLARLVAALAPGGVLLVEEFDWQSYGPAAADPAASATMNLLKAHLRGCGYDLTLGRRLPGLLRNLGLRGVDADGLVLTLRGTDSPLEPAHRRIADHALGQLREAGLINPVAAKAFQKLMNDPACNVIMPTLMSAWGRRPSPRTKAAQH